jgi:hypothetical protein
MSLHAPTRLYEILLADGRDERCRCRAENGYPTFLYLIPVQQPVRTHLGQVQRLTGTDPGNGARVVLTDRIASAGT